MTIKNVQYYVNKEKKTVVCTITGAFNVTGESFIFKSKAKCSKDDAFDEVKGRRIAESRAKYKMYRCQAQRYNHNTEYYYKGYLYNLKLTDFCVALANRELTHLKKLCEE